MIKNGKQKINKINDGCDPDKAKESLKRPLANA
jgi:hypothetical protein